MRGQDGILMFAGVFCLVVVKLIAPLLGIVGENHSCRGDKMAFRVESSETFGIILEDKTLDVSFNIIV